MTEKDRVDTIEKITNHVEQGAGLLLSRLQKEDIQALLASWTEQVQSLENALWDVFVLTGITTATNSQLDQIGELILEKRGSLSDNAYRLVLLGKIRALRSNGNGVDFLDLCLILFGNYSEYELIEQERATVIVQYFTPVVIDAETINFEVFAGLFRKAKAAGVRFMLVYPGASPSDAFTFSADDTASVSVDMGFADDSQTQGGYLDGVTE